MIRERIKALAGAVLVLQTVACGTILHPERKGQINGRVDAGVAVLDGIGLLLFIIPGVIAFAVDFSNGTIYLPGTGRRAAREIRFDPRRTTQAGIEALLRRESGVDIRLDGKDVRAIRLESTEEIPLSLNSHPS